ncbi:major facilitator superfamily domain-containing protein [Myxozyma melibiosi]|uniref:Major facilitator superfamily domain-containing protein n=1 Tax=Myxozyma melibiosi TaxID=54550 RepID=A0ABR1F554_9ASCO
MSPWTSAAGVDDDDDVILPATQPGPHSRFADTIKNGKLVSVQADPDFDVEEAEFLDLTLPEPDVGFRPWLSVIGGLAAQFSSFGYLNIVGVFLAYYKTHQLEDLSPATISWIGSVQSFVFSLSGIVCGRACDMYGPRVLTMIGTFVLPAGILLTAFCTRWIEVLIAQSVIAPFGGAMLFYGTTASMSSWFAKRRGMAFGIATSGSSIGGVILSYIFDRLATHKSYKRAIFALAAIEFCVAAVTIPTSSLRIKSGNNARRSFDFHRNFIRPFETEPVFALFTLAMTVIYLGIFVPYAFMATHSLTLGVPLDRAMHVVTAMNAGSFFGRIAAGSIADIRAHSRRWQFLTFVGVTSCAALACFPLWFMSTTEYSVVFTAAIYGAASGGILALYPAAIARISPLQEIGSRVGAVSSVMAFGSLVALPVAGTIMGKSSGGEDFGGLQIYAGTVLAGGAFVAYLASKRVDEGNIRLEDDS